MSDISLTDLLETATGGPEAAQRAFFEGLLKSTVFIASRSSAEERLITVEHEGKIILPIFSDPLFVETWAEQEVAILEKPFKALIWTLGKDTWLHLNAGQECGKEFSPWEIERLREGPDSITDILNEIGAETVDDLAIERSRDLYPELRRALLPILESYQQIEEAFLVRLKNQESDDWSPLLGIQHSGLSADRLIVLREEVERLAASGSEEIERIIIADDLGRPGSPNRLLLREATPFYIRQRPAPLVPPQSSAVSASSLLSKLGSWFRRGR